MAVSAHSRRGIPFLNVLRWESNRGKKENESVLYIFLIGSIYIAVFNDSAAVCVVCVYVCVGVLFYTEMVKVKYVFDLTAFVMHWNLYM